MDQPGKVAIILLLQNSARGQLNRKNEYFSTLRLNLVHTYHDGFPPAFRDGVHLFQPTTAVGSVQNVSGHATPDWSSSKGRFKHDFFCLFL